MTDIGYLKAVLSTTQAGLFILQYCIGTGSIANTVYSASA